MDLDAIRDADPENAETLAELYRSAYQETRSLGYPMKTAEATPNDIRRWIDEDRLLAAVVDEETIAAVRLEEPTDEYLKVSRLAVRQDHQGEGVGSRLMDWIENFAHEEGYAAVRLTTPPDHPYLPAFYRDRGYERVAEHPLHYRDYDEIVMELEVKATSG